MLFNADCARACMDKSDKIGFKELQKNVTRQKLLDVVMEHIYFAAMYSCEKREWVPLGNI